uniref:AAA family ATPase n=1 Tax=Pantoea sp. IMH TaxID=1267600 RepID=UPI000469E6E4|nr:ATPase AAA [Pantoea sp. IMH]
MTYGKKLVLVNGVPASGKSTVVRHLTDRFNWPSLSVDDIKEPFMAHYPDLDRDTNRQLGRAACQVIGSIVSQAPSKCVYVVDAWFGFQPSAFWQAIFEQAGVEQVLEIWNEISPDQAVARYGARLHERKHGHPGEDYLPELYKLAQRAKPLALGPVYELAQGKHVDYAGLDRWLSGWFSSSVTQVINGHHPSQPVS